MSEIEKLVERLREQLTGSGPVMACCHPDVLSNDLNDPTRGCVIDQGVPDECNMSEGANPSTTSKEGCPYWQQVMRSEAKPITIEEALSLINALTALQAENARLREALVSIRDMQARPYDGPEFDRAASDACPDCQRYQGHPIQHGICDEHRRPFYKREAHNAFEEKALGYRCQSSARAALQDKGEG